MGKILSSVLLILIATVAFAQTDKGKVSVTILNEQKAPVEGATVELLRSKDSGLVKIAVADKAGLAEFENILPAWYIMRVSAVGLTAGYSKSFEVKNGEATSVPAINLFASTATQMQGVTVTARKPFIQRISDRLVLDV